MLLTNYKTSAALTKRILSVCPNQNLAVPINGVEKVILLSLVKIELQIQTNSMLFPGQLSGGTNPPFHYLTVIGERIFVYIIPIVYPSKSFF